MNKVSFDDFTEALQKVTSNMTDEQKLEFYTDILETGSSSVGNRTIDITFSIVEGLSYDLNSSTGKIEEITQEDLQELENTIDEINDMDFTEDDDPIDFQKLELESDDIDDNGRELTEQEIMEIGYNPWTNEKVDLNSLLETVDSYIVIIKQMIEDYSNKGGFDYMVSLQRQKLVHFNLMKTIIKFYQDKVKLQASDGESKYPDLFIQWRIGDHESQTMEPPLLVSIENNEQAALDYWFIQDRTNGSTHEIIIKANACGEYDVSELVDYIGSRWTPESTGKFDESDDSYDELDEFEGDE
ncbi:hypothetical protein [Paracholeplasma manati]|uniref:hypothetical protein n=1 Tax=Paracholeplasma manati TaxID=591373 RepID=UPI0024082D98|nr:hypothetical protein [Paracholeplasma manati]MDG0888773.1 hypothetical protein [Paracholeplasma manati]